MLSYLRRLFGYPVAFFFVKENFDFAQSHLDSCLYGACHRSIFIHLFVASLCGYAFVFQNTWMCCKLKFLEQKSYLIGLAVSQETVARCDANLHILFVHFVRTRCLIIFNIQTRIFICGFYSEPFNGVTRIK
uniref:Uncharacterized protein n=1 Tax=Arundo donax TaxID=35708 RepID=A0A0A9HK00_ARUDO